MESMRAFRSRETVKYCNYYARIRTCISGSGTRPPLQIFCFFCLTYPFVLAPEEVVCYPPLSDVPWLGLRSLGPLVPCARIP
jgi:hypothetical protein